MTRTKFLMVFLAAMFFVFVPANTAAQTRVSFAPGKSSTVVRGTLGSANAKNASRRFMIRAKAGQHLSVAIESVKSKIWVNLVDFEGERGSDMFVALDSTGDHVFEITNFDRRAAGFKMTVAIEP